jgi:hypothetical protein
VKFYVAGPGLVFQSPAAGAVMVAHGAVFDPGAAGAPADWQPPPDSTLLFAMDEAARAALQASIDQAKSFYATYLYQAPVPGIGSFADAVIWSP